MSLWSTGSIGTIGSTIVLLLLKSRCWVTTRKSKQTMHICRGHNFTHKSCYIPHFVAFVQHLKSTSAALLLGVFMNCVGQYNLLQGAMQTLFLRSALFIMQSFHWWRSYLHSDTRYKAVWKKDTQISRISVYDEAMLNKDRHSQNMNSKEKKD